MESDNADKYNELRKLKAIKDDPYLDNFLEHFRIR